MLITSKILTRITPANLSHLKKFHPNIQYNDIIEIDIQELSDKSPILIECACEICFSSKKIQYRKYIINKNRYGYYSCKKCKNIKTGITKMRLYGDPKYNNPKQMIKTKEKLGIYIPFQSLSSFRIYRKIVNRFTRANKKILFENWDGLDFYDSQKIMENFLLQSKDMCYPTIDHKISIHEGFLKNIPPYVIGGLENICVTKRWINLSKRNQIDFKFSEFKNIKILP